MARPHGHPKTGGRAAGTPNKKSAALAEKCAQMGIDPFEEMLKIANDFTNYDPALRLSALKELCHYLYPKRKAIEHTSSFSQEEIGRLEELSKLTDEELRKMINE